MLFEIEEPRPGSGGRATLRAANPGIHTVAHGASALRPALRRYRPVLDWLPRYDPGLLIRRLDPPHVAILARDPASDACVDVANHPDATTVPGVLVHRFEGALISANAEVFAGDVLAKLAGSHTPPDALILDFAAVSDVDSTTDAALAELKRTLDDRGVRLLLARTTGMVRSRMRADGVVEAVGPENIFPTVRHTVAALEHPSSEPTPIEMRRR